MDDRRVADYFVVAGLSDTPLPLEEFSNEAAIKPTYKQDPITDITVINKSIGEKVPRGYICLDRTPSDYPANLNHGSLRWDEIYICYRRSRDKPPLTDVGVLFEGKERLITGCEVVHTTFFGSPANVNNSNSSRIYITFRRASENAASDMLAVVDLCVILENKNESPPHSYCQIVKNLNKGLMGSDVFLCYKKAMTKTDVLAYKPAILDRYPAEDYEDFPLPDSVPMFCLPMGATVECWSAKAQHPFPVFSTFILTGLHGDKVYGAAVTFYEEFPEEKLTDLQMRHLGLKNKHIREQYRIMKTVHYNKSICLLSHWPFFDAFRKLLSYLYRISITGPHTVPLERHVSHFMYDVPYPSPQRPRILVQLSHDSLSLSMPEDSPLPQSGASFITLLKNLGPENCMTILLYVLHEHKILIHSLRPAVLTSVAEAVSTLIFPLQWQCPFIPLCPLGLSDVLNAPTPYIIGLDSRYFDLFDPPPDVICIDLDTIRIWPPDDKKNLSYKMLPRKPTKVLQETLHNLYDTVSQARTAHVQDEITLEMAPIDFDFKRKHKETMLELSIQEAFLRFMACLMKGYKNYLKEVVRPTGDPNLESTNMRSLFDMQGFLKSRDKSNHKFFTHMMRTQLFNRFIEERSFVSDKDASLAFFDECTEKVTETSDEPKLIERDDSQNSERTMFILPPEPTGLPEGVQYSYNGFPLLKQDLFLQPSKKVTLAVPGKQQNCPNSPVARRTKQEVKMSQKMAQQYLSNPAAWAKCLLGHTYSLWFMILPAYVKQGQIVLKSLNTAYDVLKNMQRAKLKLPDELCYRVLLQLCGQYNHPVLAVKVYSEMKRAGVQPNAITYGYYNKAVLEGKWPTSISRGSLLWRKVRNVIIGVAKFRKAVRRRSLSVYSNSGSEYDQISQASVDSFLEDAKSDLKHESIMKHDSVSSGKPNGVSTGRGTVEIPEELASTGGTSDRGYSSMTQEEAKHFSEYVSSGETKDSQSESRLKRDMKNVLRFSFGRRNKKKETDLKEESVNGDDTVFSTTDVGPIERFRSQLGSIVRKSRSSLSSYDSHETLKGSMIGSSSAGLLMVSETLDNGLLTQSLGPGTSLSSNSSTHLRKRHKSAGDSKFRSNSLLANFRIWNTNDDNTHGIKFSDLIAKETKEDDALFETGESNEEKTAVSEMQDISEEIKDSGVALDENELTCTCDENGGDKDEEYLNGDVNGDETMEDKSIDKSEENISDTITDTSEHRDWTSSETGGDEISNSSDTAVEMRTSEIARNIRGFKSYSSPLHSTATPVTENDPLGLFIEPGSEKQQKGIIGSETPNNSPQKIREKFVSSKPFADFNKGGNTEINNGQGQCNKDNSSGNGDENKGSHLVNSPIDKVQRNLFRIERTLSFPEELGQRGQGQAFKTNRSGSEHHDQGSLIHSSTSLNDSVKSDSSAKAEFRLFRTGSFRRHKENFSGMLKFATGAVANKLSEIKFSMTPSKLGSKDSLTPSIDEIDSGNGEEEHLRESQKKFGSVDFIKRSNDTLDSAGHANGSVPESAPNHSYMADYVGRGRDEDSGSAHIKFSDVQVVLGEIAIEAEISSSCRCSRCRCLLYDEEIMAGWNADDSNLNTTCPFCNAKLVPHLLIYLKDHRGKKKPSTADLEGDTDSLDAGQHSSSDISYGKDASLCSPSSKDSHLLFGEDMDPDNHSVKSFDSAHDPHDPWTRQVPHTPKHNGVDTNGAKPDRTNEGASMSEMAFAGRHRRTASECLTSATDIPYSSSVESFDSLSFRALRSPLNISIDEQDSLPKHPSQTPETKRGMFERRPCSMEPISVPYLSPLVLRKNLETIIESEGNNSLAVDAFVDEHPIIYWNLVYYFRRIDTPSHLPGFLLTAKSFNKDPTEQDTQKYSNPEVLIRPLWDNVKIHEEVGLPMHLAWNKGQSSTTIDALITEAQPFNRAVMHQIITNIQCNDVLTPIKLVMNGRRRFKPRKSRFRSMYREILFLSFSSCGRENIDHDAFDREYRLAFTRLSAGELKRLQRDDRPRTDNVMWCRKVFMDLEV